ncbi:MAG TPA: UDP-N-acetylglucosamine--N-acetylmuramyl-(pentapeptide) pyrophosphoryl-undecaprenol N-acetylglucosamine transferase [Sporichthyaceae bacterium]|jgi:UDP-N-acetylglucosamine--N-acetylmuramyl-(pentapeptide) pyrophosphoryl-undecaprenol N-acetylglucosamine transferase|nr:UDP-N-acetylglucosamine--N-acetylmuramyl-(pentapeptide) pyrophosphoryl-undecaprenol N-acetylglucosamine transferase [Sporichthyaceae bacterium]
MHVVLAAGGTAGHIEPALALADALRRRDPGIGITVLGTATGMENTLVPARGYPVAHVPRVPLPRKPSADLLRLPPRVIGAYRTAKDVLRELKADALVGFGGYVCVPAYLAARSAGLPIVVHEANTPAGIANRIGARLTDFVATTARADDLPHGRVIGLPLRRSIATLDRPATRAAAAAHFGLQPDLPTLLIFGGSQGARSLNTAGGAAAAGLSEAGIQVLHAVGRDNWASRGSLFPTVGPSEPNEDAATVTVPFVEGAAPYVIVPYLERMDLAYAAADVALCRSGAMTCAELAAVGLPAWYVPLPIGNGEQRRNALPLVEAGGGGIVEDAALDAAWMMANLVPLLKDPDRVAAMSQAAATHGRRDADEGLADLLMEAVAAKGRPS